MAGGGGGREAMPGGVNRCQLRFRVRCQMALLPSGASSSPHVRLLPLLLPELFGGGRRLVAKTEFLP